MARRGAVLVLMAGTAFAAPVSAVFSEEPPPPLPRSGFAPPLEAIGISDIQRLLAARGYDAGPATGAMNEATYRAILAFERDSGLPQDGTAGPLVENALHFMRLHARPELAALTPPAAVPVPRPLPPVILPPAPPAPPAPPVPLPQAAVPAPVRAPAPATDADAVPKASPSTPVEAAPIANAPPPVPQTPTPPAHEIKAAAPSTAAATPSPIPAQAAPAPAPVPTAAAAAHEAAAPVAPPSAPQAAATAPAAAASTPEAAAATTVAPAVVSAAPAVAAAPPAVVAAAPAATAAAPSGDYDEAAAFAGAPSSDESAAFASHKGASSTYDEAAAFAPHQPATPATPSYDEAAAFAGKLPPRPAHAAPALVTASAAPIAAPAVVPKSVGSIAAPAMAPAAQPSGDDPLGAAIPVGELHSPDVAMAPGDASVREAQEYLKRLGYFDGDVDGIMSWRTVEALVKFDASGEGPKSVISENGRIDAMWLARLKTAAAAKEASAKQ